MINFSETPAPSWDDPLAMLYACHAKVQRFCAELARLPDHLAQHGCDAAALGSIGRVRRYFNQAAPLHHADEEQDFFPALIALAPDTAAAVAALESEHESLSALWTQLDAQLANLAENGAGCLNADSVARFAEGYRRHIAQEEPLFETGRRLLPPATAAALGGNMAARRRA